MIILDYRDKRPIYEQIVEKLEKLIVSGALEVNDKMPSVRSLGVELSVNPNTIQRAYNQLEQEGYLYTVSGRGSFVSPKEEWQSGSQAKQIEAVRAAVIKAKQANVSAGLLQEMIMKIYKGEEE